MHPITGTTIGMWSRIIIFNSSIFCQWFHLGGTMELGFWNHGTGMGELVPELWNQGWN